MDPHVTHCHSEESGRYRCACGSTFGVGEIGAAPALCLHCAAAECWPGAEVYPREYPVDGCASILLHGITFVHVRWADEGEAEGGLGALIRFMAGAEGVELPPPSPSGWYMQGTFDRRGEWSRPIGPFHSADAAIVDALRRMDEGAYYRDEG